MGLQMIQLEHSLVAGSQEPVDINELLPERPFIMGEFSPAYEAFKQVTIAGLAPATHYEYIQALQLVDLNWAILQRKASADLELSNGMKHAIKSQLLDMLRLEERKKHWHLYEAFVDEGGNKDDFEDPTDHKQMQRELERLMKGIFLKDSLLREQVFAKVISRGVDPRLVLSA